MAEIETGALTFEHLAARGRFRLVQGDLEAAVLDYRVLDRRSGPAVWDIVHTYSPPQFRGAGLASALVQHVFDQARSAGVRIVPSCPYIPAWVVRHPGEGDLIAAAR